MKKLLALLFFYTCTLLPSSASAVDVMAQYHVWWKVDASCPSSNPVAEWFHWVQFDSSHNGCNFRGGTTWLRNVSTQAYPIIGPYEGGNQAVARWHMRVAKAAGLTAFSISVMPGASASENTEFMTKALAVLQIASEENFKVGLEVWKPIGATTNAAFYSRLIANINSLEASPYASAIHKIDGLTVVWGNRYGGYDTDANFVANLVNQKPAYYLWNGDTTASQLSAMNAAITNGSKVGLVNQYNTPTTSNWIYHGDLSDRINSFGAAGHIRSGHIYPYFHDAYAVPAPNTRFGLSVNQTELANFLVESAGGAAQLIIVESWNDFIERTAIEPGMDINTWQNLGQETIYQGDPYRTLKQLATHNGITFTAPTLRCSIVDSVMITAGITACSSDTTAPTAPSALSLSSAGSTSLDLIWTGSTDGGTGVYGYHLERCTGAACSNFATVSLTTAANRNDTGLTASTTYRYRVRTSDGAGNFSAYSSILTAATVSPDVTNPVVTITGPTSAATLNSTSNPQTISGSCSDNVACTSVTWTNSRGGTGTAVGTASWSFAVPYQEGVNIITVTGHDAVGNIHADVLTVTYTGPPPPPGLMQQTDLVYVGAFRLPAGNHSGANQTFEFSGGFVSGNVYEDPVNGKSLFMSGFLSAGYVSTTVSIAQIKIPALLNPETVGIVGLNTATVIQNFDDPSNGAGTAALTGNGFGTMINYGGKLIGTQSVAYDATCGQTHSAWVSSPDFANKASATGPYRFNLPTTPSIIGPRWAGGAYMALVPAEYQSALGGNVVSGSGPWSIVSCGSPGPSLFVIDADTLVTQPSTTPAISTNALVYYAENATQAGLGHWNSNDPDQIVDGRNVPDVTVVDPYGRGTFTIPYEDNAMRVSGVLFPGAGTRSVLFFGLKGLGPYCYGEGTANQALHGTPVGNGQVYCYDLDGVGGTGDHSYPYSNFVWAYDADQLILAKNGSLPPWQVYPYTGWAFKFSQQSVTGQSNEPVGVSYDPETKRAYMVLANSDSGHGSTPIVHVFQVNTTPTLSPVSFRIQ